MQITNVTRQDSLGWTTSTRIQFAWKMTSHFELISFESAKPSSTCNCASSRWRCCVRTDHHRLQWWSARRCRNFARVDLTNSSKRRHLHSNSTPIVLQQKKSVNQCTVLTQRGLNVCLNNHEMLVFYSFVILTILKRTQAGRDMFFTGLVVVLVVLAATLVLSAVVVLIVVLIRLEKG